MLFQLIPKSNPNPKKLTNYIINLSLVKNLILLIQVKY